jgi:hypothetical protein
LRESFAYVAADSWLVDYGALLRVFREALGADLVVAIDYERALRQHGSIIPGILGAAGADPSQVLSWDGYWCNAIPVRRPLVQRIQSSASYLRRAKRVRNEMPPE